VERAEGAARILFLEPRSDPHEEIDKIRIAAEVRPERSDHALIVDPERAGVSGTAPFTPSREFELASPFFHGQSVARRCRADIRANPDRSYALSVMAPAAERSSIQPMDTSTAIESATPESSPVALVNADDDLVQIFVRDLADRRVVIAALDEYGRPTDVAEWDRRASRQSLQSLMS
jgi:hypothetical protein